MTISYARRFLPDARLGAAALCLLGVGLTGCSSDGGAEGPADTGSSDTASDTASGGDQVSGETGDLKDPQGAIAALSEFICERDAKGVWSAEGILTNTSKSQTRFLVSVSVIKSKTSEVLASIEEMYTLKPMAHRRLVWGDIYDKGGAKLQCVPRVVSGK